MKTGKLILYTFVIIVLVSLTYLFVHLFMHTLGKTSKLSPVQSSTNSTAQSTISPPNSTQPVASNFDSLIPLNELGLGIYKGFTGGLYTDGANQPSGKYLEEGLGCAQKIQPLDKDGNPDSNGKIVLLSIGMSNTTMEFSSFKRIADADTQKNPQLAIVDGAQGGQDAKKIKDPNDDFWGIVNQRLVSSNVSSKQVQAVWLKEAVINENNPFPIDAKNLQEYLKTIILNIKQKYPNIQIVYLSSRIYAGYATTILNPEPFAYESGFSVKWLIEDQINGKLDAGMPWLAWGPYLWANGTRGHSDGLIWEQSDLSANDGTHPSASGQMKVAKMLLNFFKTEKTAQSWFLK